MTALSFTSPLMEMLLFAEKRGFLFVVMRNLGGVIPTVRLLYDMIFAQYPQTASLVKKLKSQNTVAQEQLN
jgi:hypothetical protein